MARYNRHAHTAIRTAIRSIQLALGGNAAAVPSVVLLLAVEHVLDRFDCICRMQVAMNGLMDSTIEATSSCRSKAKGWSIPADDVDDASTQRKPARW